MISNASYRDQVQVAFVECGTISELQAEAESADAGFDGGEFSGPAHGRILERLLDLCAQRHGFPDFDHLQDEAIRIGLYDPMEDPWEGGE